MIDMILATSNPLRVRDFLVARNVCKIEDGALVGVKPGFEYTEVPNPLATSGTGTEADPYVYDTRKVYLIRFAHDTAADGIDGQDGVGEDTSDFTRSRLVKWVKANGVAATLTGVNGYSVEAWRVSVSGTNVFLARNDAIAAWQ
jgi:hypothetical protein